MHAKKFHSTATDYLRATCPTLDPGESLQLTHDTKPHSAAAGGIGRRLPISRAILLGRTAPGTAADHALIAAGVHPRAAVMRRARVIVVPAIGDPLGNIAVNVVDAEWIRGETHRRCRAPVAIVVIVESIRPTAVRRRAVATAGEILH